jgi:hypothetical protein
MRLLLYSSVWWLLVAGRAAAQGTPPPVDFDPAKDLSTGVSQSTPPPVPAPAPDRNVRRLVEAEVKKEVEKALDQSYPAVDTWHPLTARQKFDVFLWSTYRPRTFAGAAVDAAFDKIQNDNSQYETGFRGVCQHYGIELATSETNVFFERFLIPTALKQDPRYFRNPNLPFMKRALYSMSRVVLTRSDSGHQTFNASYVLGGAASQALSDLYVPGQRQGMYPIADRLTFNLARDAGFNLLHEFWPDVRRKVFHR